MSAGFRTTVTGRILRVSQRRATGLYGLRLDCGHTVWRSNWMGHKAPKVGKLAHCTTCSRSTTRTH